MLTDLTAEARAGYVGRDNRKEGADGRLDDRPHRAPPGKVGIIIGSHRYLCQETAEISFRSYLREHAPAFRPLEPLVNLEDPRLARSRDARPRPAQSGSRRRLYLRRRRRRRHRRGARGQARRRVAIVCNEITATTRLGLIDGILTAVIATPLAALSQRTVEAMGRAIIGPARRHAAADPGTLRLLYRREHLRPVAAVAFPLVSDARHAYREARNKFGSMSIHPSGAAADHAEIA